MKFPATLVEAVKAVSSSAASVEELATDLQRRLSRTPAALNCFLQVAGDLVEQARLIDRRSARGEPLPLAGAFLSVKDLITVLGTVTTGGSRAPHRLYKARSDATVIRRLREAGAVFAGKTNLHEFAFGITSENEHFGAVKNPWSPDRVAGGSSGGSAAAVAAGLGNGSVGTDTRGSIRIPAACCGICGLKGTRGAVPLGGVLPLSPSLDHVGPMARTVEDLALLWEVMSAARKTRPSVLPDGRRPRLGMAAFYFRDLEAEVAAAVDAALQDLARAGCPVAEVAVEGLEEALEASDWLSLAEALAIHEDGLRRHPDLYGPRVRTRLVGGYRISALQLIRAREAQSRMVRDLSRAFREVDVLVAPTIPIPAPRLGTLSVTWDGEEETLVSAMVRFNAPQNMAGVPALSLPCGFTRDGLPLGLQLIADRGREDLLLEVGRLYQRLSDWHLRRPPLASG
jgi:aspartyl-tRNA(Asn)/glutamyl-tRNA(Gln) amidotransferase subunit A